MWESGSTTSPIASTTMDDGQSLRLCVICDKPFTKESSYNRHVSYCRRSQQRPRHRQKSCRSCSLAKTKCSFHPRCTRCVAKGLECTYDRQSAAQKAKPSTLDVSPVLPIWPLSPNDDHAFEFPHDASMVDLSDLLTVPGLDTPETSNDTDGNDLPLLNDADNTALELSSFFANSAYMLSAPVEGGFLARLPVSNSISQHSATVVMQALRAFPQMMLRKPTFPPFIHPHCHCYPLPKPLAHCMSIAHIYVSSSVETRPFLWHSIKQEQQRILDDLTKMAKEEVLAAVQAQLIYIAMRVAAAEDAQKSDEWNLQMVVTFQILCERFMNLCDEPFCLPESWRPGTNWNDWVFAESRRRTACVWFLISRVVCVRTGISCPTIDSYMTLPLSSPKTLWEAATHDAWASEYETYSSTLPGLGLDNFGSLVDFNKRWKEPVHARKLNVWNAQVDQLGSLLNAAVSMI